MDIDPRDKPSLSKVVQRQCGARREIVELGTRHPAAAGPRRSVVTGRHEVEPAALFDAHLLVSVGQGLIPAQGADDAKEIVPGRRRQSQWQPRDRMGQRQLHAREKQAAAAEQAGEEAVVAALAVGRVADHGVGKVLEMAPDLVPAAGLGPQLEERIAAARVTVDGTGQLGHSEPPVVCHRRLRLCGALSGKGRLVVVAPARERMIDRPCLGRMSTDHGEMALANLAPQELGGQLPCHFGVECERQHAGGAAVEAMNGVNVSADLVPQQLHGELGGPAIERGAVNEQAGRLVDSA